MIRWILLSALFVFSSYADTIPGEGTFNYLSDELAKERNVKIDTAFANERMVLISRLVNGKKRPVATGAFISAQGHFLTIRAVFLKCLGDEKVEKMNDPTPCRDLVGTYQGKDYPIKVISRKPMPQAADLGEMFTHNYSAIGQIATSTKAFEIRKAASNLEIPSAVAILPAYPFLGAGFDHAGVAHLTWGSLALDAKDHAVFMIGYPGSLWDSDALKEAKIDASKHTYQVPIPFLGGPALSRDGKLAGIMVSLMDVNYNELIDVHRTGKAPTGVFNGRNILIKDFLEPDASGIFSVEGEAHRLKAK